ncbi:dihydropteroate synthase [Bacillus aerolatus]|uniref:Dihydropteroate synthase n=1 Tax=Bacillus aerolatus TaxID=2653354 RepID=A0A6I1FKX3_9BACI|nr:dihydropteroate synthase [Bacillus aerolatus]KAB7704290.1 dihydropteroate synthase [Bacillus aerolatus]
MNVSAGPYNLDFTKKTYIMGILNTTPDSFSDGGQFDETGTAIDHAQKMIEAGADIIDIGGESTRPGYSAIPLEKELERVLPVIQAVAAHTTVPISIDTYKAETARQSVEAGAHIINDIWGAKKDPEIAAVAAEKKVPIILMHNRDNMNYESFIRDVLIDLYESIDIAIKAGVPEKQIILDPGIGFAKDMEQHLLMLQHLDKVAALGFPVLLGASRKRIVGHVLNLPVEERMEGTGAVCCFGIERGCHILRVHDVKPISRMAKMMDALIGKG